MPSHDHYTHRLLSEIESGTYVSQRSLARSLGIALGLTNLLVHRLVRKGWVRMIQIKPNRVSYLLTPAGLSEKARMSQTYLAASVKFYIDARDRIRQSFEILSSECAATGEREKRIAFYGAGELAEIGFVCMQGGDLNLVAVVDERPPSQFFGMPVHIPERLNGNMVDGKPFDRLVVMYLDDTDRIKSKLHALGVPAKHVFWLCEPPQCENK